MANSSYETEKQTQTSVIRAARGAITAQLQKIEELSQEYEDLRKFKSAVENAHGTFAESAGTKKGAVESLAPKQENSRCVEEYYNGMDSFLYDIGNAVVSAAFSGLTLKCALKMEELKLEITVCETAIDTARKTIHDANEALSALEHMISG